MEMIQQIEESRLTRHFGERMGKMLRSRARGIDNTANKAMKRHLDYNVSSGKAFEGECQPDSFIEFREYLFELCYDIREKLQVRVKTRYHSCLPFFFSKLERFAAEINAR